MPISNLRNLRNLRFQVFFCFSSSASSASLRCHCDMSDASTKPVALITGASRGIGRAAAVELSRRGYGIAAIARTESLLQQLCTQIDRALPLVVDVSDHDQVDRAVRQTIERFGR